MAESPSWQERLEEARERSVFEPTPSGGAPHVTTTEHLAALLHDVELAVQASVPNPTSAAPSAAYTIGYAVKMLLREAINAREYQRHGWAQAEIQPDRVGDLCDRLDALLERLPPMVSPRG